MSTERTQPDQTTRDAERRDAAVDASGGPVPTPEEEAAAERAPVDDLAAVGEHHDEMRERGANQKGEGKIS